MRRTRIWLCLIVAVAAVLPAIAQHGGQPGMPPRPHDDFIGRLLFPPEMILANQGKLALSDAQTAEIKKLLADTHAQVVDRQVDMAAAAERLEAVLEVRPIDEDAALAAAESVVTLENGIKRLHLSLLIRLKNTLTAEQIELLEQLRQPRR